MEDIERGLMIMEGYKPFVREAEVIGSVKLSIQASSFAYSTPRSNLPNIDDYTHVEVAILNNFKGELIGADGKSLGKFLLPSDVIETKEFDYLWHFGENTLPGELKRILGVGPPDDEEYDEVASYVPLEVAYKLRDALRYHFGETENS